MDNDWVLIAPPFGEEADARSCFARSATALANTAAREPQTDTAAVQDVRATALLEASSLKSAQAVKAAISLIADLVNQGWHVRVDRERVQIRRPDPSSSLEEEKDRVRRSLLIARHEQLSEDSVRAFVRSMEARQWGTHGWTSVHSVMRDGGMLAEALEQVNRCDNETERLQGLRAAIQPYVELVDENATCSWTGLRLADIWRYFRYTWLNPSRSTPGRTMMLLVRDAAVEPHPVMGIAALSSSIIQQTQRDKWIGWDKDSVIAELRQSSSNQLPQWLLASLDQLLNEVHIQDFLADGVLRRKDVDQPGEESVQRLRGIGKSEKRKHHLQPRALNYRALQSNDMWDQLVKSSLYRSKRASMLADLLSIRLSFQEAGLTRADADSLKSYLDKSAFRDAVGRLVRMLKASRVGVNMMDISVCGAIAPYNEILGGKLVSLLLTSPEIQRLYATRYGRTPSVIASCMQGKKVVRNSDLVLLCTTGHFSGGSSQYNRVRLPSEAVGGQSGEVAYRKLDKPTESYGTFHISQVTMDEMFLHREMVHDGSDVHSIFGEGVNPRMRKIRESLDDLGFPSDYVLRTGTARSVYVVPLARNFRDILLGRDAVPDYILPSDAPAETSKGITEYWRRRWLDNRIRQPAVLQAMRKHSLAAPTEHGGTVRLPPKEEGPLDHLEESGQLFLTDVMLDCEG